MSKLKYILKKSALALLLAGAGLLLGTDVRAAKQDEIFTQIDPANVLLGEPAELRLISIMGFPEIQKLPVIPGLKWESQQPMQSKRTAIVNTKRATTFNSVYSFTVNKEGIFTIPAMKVRVGHITKKLDPIAFKAYKHKLLDSEGNSTDLDELLYVSAVLLTDKDYFYLGQDVPLEIRMYSIRGLPVEISWPKIIGDNIVLRNYGQLNQGSKNFLPPVRRTVKLENQLFNVDIFKTSIRVISPGELKGKITIPCVIKIPKTRKQKRSSDPFEDFFRDDFFGSQYRKIQYKLETNLPAKEIKSLPDIPENSIFLGLVGEWKLNTYMSAKELKSGDPVTLRVVASGTGTLDTLVAPELTLPGFRIFPPEIKKGNVSVDGYGKAEIRYAMIPKAKGPVKIDLNFSSFSPKSGTFIEQPFQRTYNVKKGEGIANSVVDDSGSGDQLISPELNGKSKERLGILYLKRHKSGGVSLPLIKNRFFTIIFFILLGPLVLLGAELYFFKHSQLKKDPLLRRKTNAKKRKRKVIDTIANANPEEMDQVIQNDVTPYLNDLLGHPPGTSAAELADKVQDPELADCLHSGSASAFMPGITHEDPKTLKKKLLKAIQHVTVFSLLCLSAFTLSAAQESKKMEFSDPLKAYETEHFKEAENFYREKLNPKHPNPAILYNLGNCLFQQGKFPEALICYEQAKRLDPSDTDIIENLNYIRRKLMLPEVGKADNPLDSLENFRDNFRPDTWLLFAALTWSLCWIFVVLRRYLSNRKWITGLTICLLLFMLSIFAYVSQVNTTYSPKNAIVIKSNIPVYSLPTTTSRKSEFKLQPGSEVTIEEERHNWKRIRDEQSEGWVKSDAVEKLWPY